MAVVAPVNRITSSVFHVPGGPVLASQIVVTAPPDASIFLSLPPARKAMARLSGDQNGAVAFNVPASGCADSVSRLWIHSARRPFASGAT